MSNIRVDVDYTIHDGSELKFRSPVDCSAITGLIVYYPGADGNTTSKVFAFADAHGNNVGAIDHLFAENVVVKVILDVTTSMAFVQNADTNAYLEAQLASKAPAGYGVGVSDAPSHLTVDSTAFDNFLNIGWYAIQTTFKISDKTFYFVMLRVTSYGSGCLMQEVIPVDTDYMLRRYCWHGAWTEWDWDCPPMTAGVAYRTTERYNGKPVYTKCLELGALTCSTLTHFGLDVYAADNPTFVDFQLYITDGTFTYDLLSNAFGSTSAYLWSNGQKYYINLVPSGDMTGWTGRAIVKWIYG